MALGGSDFSAEVSVGGECSGLHADENVIYHYTSTVAALKILQERTIWLSAPWHLNDPLEGAGFLEFLASSKDEKNREKACCLIKNHLFYVACFSEEGDLLSQWRAYADDAQGVSIGFDRCVLRSCLARQSLLAERPVEYVDEVGELDPTGEAHKAREVISNHGGSPSAEYLQTLSKVRYAIKRRAYMEEREVRLIFTPEAHPFGVTKLPSDKAEYDRRYFGSQGEIRDYYALTFSESVWSSLVRCVIFGPRNRTNDKVARDMLRKYGLDKTLVRYSKANYRK